MPWKGLKDLSSLLESMKALAVVHAENSFLQPESSTIHLLTLAAGQAFYNIAQEIGRRFRKGLGRVYFLSYESTSPDSEMIYTGIRKYAHGIEFIPKKPTYLQQFLAAKRKFMDDNINHVDIGGIWSDECVDGFFNVLTAVDLSRNTKYMLREAAEREGWSKSELSDIYEHKLSARVRKSLTDDTTSMERMRASFFNERLKELAAGQF